MDLFDNKVCEEKFEELSEELSYEYLQDLKSSDMEKERADKLAKFDQFRMACMMARPSILSTLGIIQENGEITGILMTKKEADMVARLMCLMFISE